MSGSIEDRLAALAKLVEQWPIAARPAAPDELLTWLEVDEDTRGRLADRRLLVIGGEAVKDAHAIATRGARHVVACVPPSEPQSQRRPQNGEEARVDVWPLVWQELEPQRHGSFELVLCNDLVHRVTEPFTLLRTLRTMITDGGTLLIGAMMIDDPERSEYLRFIPDRYAGDESWWFVPGRLALRWLLQASGFEVEAEFAEREGPRDLFPVVAGYLRATAS